MSEMSITDYLAQGGQLTSPENVPARYRAELMRLMASFVDSELAGAAGFADMINAGPGIKERIAAAKIVLEKTDNADKVLKIMGEFGANTDRYATHHPWTDRLNREADIGTTRSAHDMRLSVFNYPLTSWEDAVVMNMLMGLAVSVQLSELCRVSYQPLAGTFRDIMPVEVNHTDLAIEGIEHMLAAGADKAALQRSVDYWWPRVAASFGQTVSSRAEQLTRFGLRHSTNAELREEWDKAASEQLETLGLSAP
ncbi:phenylacetate-CoA oxygenase subunit PaaI [Aliiroseovarius crassostreae]|uniref:Phenylacetic acid catabolic protein n=1 Tax=Aliiroseovarius crassostreae TaxID=154981 RepID=UPI0021AF45C8|nr:Phenylacetic acid catabolic protein [Aliiroseovarius crassostreae]UWQ09329.1 phenylacetate-CoA oxygenase subunit PaaI [Aliiroseovarius crassostreae]UWQ12405.1 phenylacetate-CoA oxygenase subunit PaaI [Aliiroseovarius crassostreae]